MTTTMAEPEWDEQTRETAMALDSVDLCPLCGRPSEVCQDPDLQDDWAVGLPVRCHASTALMQAQARVTEETNPNSGALLWNVRLREGVRRG